jgi:hypothetical protein
MGVLTQKVEIKTWIFLCFRTLPRRLGVLTEIKFWGEAITELFPSPLEVTGGLTELERVL